MDPNVDPFKEFEKQNQIKKDPSLVSEGNLDNDPNFTFQEQEDLEDILKKQEEIDFYAILNLPRDATVEDIKNSYKRLAFTYHPDKQANTPELKEQTQEKFALISFAKDTLCDPKLRAIYDEFGFQGLQNSKALVNKYEEIDNLIKALEKVHKQMKEDKYLQDIFAHGSQNIKISYVSDYNLFQFNSYRSSQTFKIASRYGILELTPSIKLDKQRGIPELNVGYSYPITNNQHISISNSINENVNITKLQVNSLLRPDILGTFHCNLINGIPIECGGSLTKNISETVTGSISSSIGFAQSLVGLNVKRNIEKRVIELQLTAGTSSEFELVVSRKIPLSRATMLVVSLSAHQGFSLWDHSLLSVGAFIQKKLSKVFQISLGMEVTQERYLYTLGFHHKYQAFHIPIPIYSDISIWNSLLFFTVPSVSLSILKYLIINPLMKKSEIKKQEEIKKVIDEATLNEMKKAIIDIKLMTPTVQKKVLQEQANNGLVIQEAVYGILDDFLNNKNSGDNNNSNSNFYNYKKILEDNNINNINNLDDFEIPPYIDVTIPLQYLVDDSKLSLYSNKRSDLLGFWDPRPNQEKKLKVTYYFHNKLHTVIVNENEQLSMPLRSHLIK